MAKVEQKDKIMEVKLIVKPVELEDGRSFFSYKTVLKDGKKYDVRLKKDCEIQPEKSCVAYVKASDISIDYRYQFPRVWIANIQMTKDYSVVSGEKISELFDEVE